jgi:hypothetical protein
VLVNIGVCDLGSISPADMMHVCVCVSCGPSFHHAALAHIQGTLLCKGGGEIWIQPRFDDHQIIMMGAGESVCAQGDSEDEIALMIVYLLYALLRADHATLLRMQNLYSK